MHYIKLLAKIFPIAGGGGILDIPTRQFNSALVWDFAGLSLIIYFIINYRQKF